MQRENLFFFLFPSESTFLHPLVASVTLRDTERGEASNSGRVAIWRGYCREKWVPEPQSFQHVVSREVYDDSQRIQDDSKGKGKGRGEGNLIKCKKIFAFRLFSKKKVLTLQPKSKPLIFYEEIFSDDDDGCCCLDG